MNLSLEKLIRDIPDFPKAGIVFKDITPLLAFPEGLRQAVLSMAAPFRDLGIQRVAGIESRGFMFAPAIALELGAGFVPMRKPGKLPYRTRSASYVLEYGQDRLEIHEDALLSGERVLVVDDVIATGGTAQAAGDLVGQSGAELVGYSFLIELSFLAGRARLAPSAFHASITY
jgi:adenine phosphoribosyltransferase